MVFFDIVRRGGAVAHLAGAIATATGHLVSWWHVGGFGEVWLESAAGYVFDEIGSELPGSELPPHRTVYVVDASDSHYGTIRPGRPEHIAVVGWTPNRQKMIDAGFTFEGADVFLKNTAGNPDVVGLLRGEVGALLEVDTVDLHDAAYLIPFSLLGGRVVSLSGDEIHVMRYFERLDPEERKIGPFIAASNDLAAQRILSYRRQAKENAA